MILTFFVVVGVSDEETKRFFNDVRQISKKNKTFSVNGVKPICDQILKPLYRFDKVSTASMFLSHLASIPEEINIDLYDDIMYDQVEFWYNESHYNPWYLIRELTANDLQGLSNFYEPYKNKEINIKKENLKMSVYTIKMNILDKPNSFRYCKENRIIGIGWGLKNSEKSLSANIDDIKLDLYKKYKSSYLSACLNTMQKMKCGDYVWTADVLNSTPIYYLCELTSRYQCFDESIWTECGIANGFNCTYNAITTDSLIPAGAVRYLNSNGLIYEIDDNNEIKATKSIANAIKEMAVVK